MPTFYAIDYDWALINLGEFETNELAYDYANQDKKRPSMLFMVDTYLEDLYDQIAEHLTGAAAVLRDQDRAAWSAFDEADVLEKDEETVTLKIPRKYYDRYHEDWNNFVSNLDSRS